MKITKIMKIAAAILLVAALTAAMAVPALAANGTIGKYTPVLDGEKDEAYDQSFKVNVYTDQDIPVGEYFHSEGDAPATNAADATAWFLYDDAFVYVFVDVKDPNMYDIGKDVFDSRVNNYQSDSVELWLVFGDDEPYIKFSAVAYGHGMFGDLDGGAATAAEFAAAGFDAIVITRGDGYSAEFKAPIAQYGFKAGDKFYFTLQLNNMVSDGDLVVSGRQLMNSGGEYSELTLGAPIVIAAPEPDPEPEPDQPEAQGGGGDAPEQPVVPATPSAPKTGDSLIIPALIAAILAACAFAVVKRAARHTK